MFSFIKKQGHHFIWVTDGAGWKKTLAPLEDAFNFVDYIFNLNMVINGALEDVL